MGGHSCANGSITFSCKVDIVNLHVAPLASTARDDMFADGGEIAPLANDLDGRQNVLVSIFGVPESVPPS